ncbi:ankyrin [Fragilariopsis cylindrus CCMP1102]|uniref:Ankyrin n=1 Tax=Fragilariopsis cylindrus CCMP1102 TaxID=635003 RepID=A0A1E7EJX2_9STRA|nr:ankyrin [Fragilariopsis cylindrus CCMP1102]|eukprot:OEU06178.1 ankyrin [Fragilariopsis cylindrus CCMP1102]
MGEDKKEKKEKKAKKDKKGIDDSVHTGKKKEKKAKKDKKGIDDSVHTAAAGSIVDDESEKKRLKKEKKEKKKKKEKDESASEDEDSSEMADAAAEKKAKKKAKKEKDAESASEDEDSIAAMSAAEKKAAKKKAKKEKASQSSSDDDDSLMGFTAAEKKAAKKKAKKEKASQSSSDSDDSPGASAVVSEDDDPSSSSRSSSKKSHKKSKSSSSLSSVASKPKKVKKVDLFDAGKAPYPTENAKKYGDVKDETLKKQCKRVYKLLNFDPWNEAMRFDDDDTCDYLIENPEPCKIKFEFEGFSGCIYPISMCYALQASRDTVEAAYDAYPPAIKETDLWVGTPYHYADKEGYTPLHLACENGAEASVVKLLVEAYPGVVYVTAAYEMTPIHFASSQNANVGVIKALLEGVDNDPSICKLTDMLGHTPLHMAIMGLATDDVIEFLVKACPETVWTKTKKGELPLEIAQRKRYPAALLQMLEKSMEQFLLENDS